MSGTTIAAKLIGHDSHDHTPSQPDGILETTWWIGKPWRRVELVVRDVKCAPGQYREWDLTITLAVPRWGWHWHTEIKRSFYDYGEEPNQ